MAKEFAKAFYKSKAWRRCRKAYIDKRVMIDGGMCEECHKQLGYIVHHKIKLTPKNINNPNIALNLSNLAYLCKDCHDENEAHPFVKHSKPICEFDMFGQPLPPISESDV